MTVWNKENREWVYDHIVTINDNDFTQANGLTNTISQLIVLSEDVMVVMFNGYSRVLLLNETWEWAQKFYSGSIQILALPQPEQEQATTSTDDPMTEDSSSVLRPRLGVVAHNRGIATITVTHDDLLVDLRALKFNVAFPTAIIPAGSQHIVVMPDDSSEFVQIWQRSDDEWAMETTPFKTVSHAISPTLLVVTVLGQRGTFIYEKVESEWIQRFSFNEDVFGSIQQLMEGGLVYTSFNGKTQDREHFEHILNLIYLNAGTWQRHEKMIELDGMEVYKIIALPNQLFAVITNKELKIFHYQFP